MRTPRPVSARGRHVLLGAVVALLVCCLLPVAATAVQAPPSVDLSTSEGPPGAPVTAAARGFGGCVLPEPREPEATQEPEATPTPQPLPESPVVIGGGFAPAIDEEPEPGTVRFSWREDGLATVTAAAAAGGVTLLVPEGASLGSHSLTATCVEDPTLRASAPFTVTAPPEPPVRVPNLTSMTVPEAVPVLDDAGLVLGSRSGDGDRITDQTPDPGTEAARGSRVDVVLEPVTPREPVLVPVPSLVDRTTDEARAALLAAELRLGAVTGPNGDPELLVRSQTHAPGSMVRKGTRVGVAVGPRVPSLVDVPDLVGGTVEQAEDALSAAGLVLAGSQDGDRTVGGQEPAARTRVPVGSAVTVTLTPAAGAGGGTDDAGPEDGAGVDSGNWWTGRWPTLAVLVVGLGAGLATARRLLSDRDGKWVDRHVRAVARPGSRLASSPPEVDDDARQTHVVRLAPHHDPGTSTLEEI